MNEVDKLRQLEILNGTLQCLDSLLKTQVGLMEPLTQNERTIARQGLTAVYVDLATGFHADQMGQFEKATEHRQHAGQSFSDMRTKLESK
jgi:hypothetical protein